MVPLATQPRTQDFARITEHLATENTSVHEDLVQLISLNISFGKCRTSFQLQGVAGGLVRPKPKKSMEAHLIERQGFLQEGELQGEKLFKA